MIGSSLEGFTPAAVVFDCDGLLVDTESCWTVAETELLARRGLTFPLTERASLLGSSIPAASTYLAERFADGSSPERVAIELIELVDEVLAREARAMPGARELVTLVGERLPMAVASNSTRALLDAALARGGLAAALPVSVAADEVALPKPAPDLYRAACARLGAEPARCLALEDSATGLAAARAAGLRTVAVPTLPHAALEADARVASLEDPGLVAWARGWPPRDGAIGRVADSGAGSGE